MTRARWAETVEQGHTPDASGRVPRRLPATPQLSGVLAEVRPCARTRKPVRSRPRGRRRARSAPADQADRRRARQRGPAEEHQHTDAPRRSVPPAGPRRARRTAATPRAPTAPGIGQRHDDASATRISQIRLAPRPRHAGCRRRDPQRPEGRTASSTSSSAQPSPAAAGRHPRANASADSTTLDRHDAEHRDQPAGDQQPAGERRGGKAADHAVAGRRARWPGR